jgi:tetratricopeptide (TPR) repeat protein
MGRHKEAEVHAAGALAVAERLGDTGLEARALLALGRTANDLGRTDRARALLDRARRRFRTRGDLRGEAWTLHRLSETWSIGDYRRELDDLRQAHDLFERSRDRWGRSVVAQDLAYLLSMTGGSEYRVWHGRARRLAEREGDVRSKAAIARTEGCAAFYRGCPVDAIEVMSDARRLAAQSGDRYAEADAVLIRALAESAVGSPIDAEAAADELLRFAKELGSSRLRTSGLLAGARAALRAGKPEVASRRLAAALRLVRERGLALVGAEAEFIRTQLALDRGDFAVALETAPRAMTSARKYGWDLWFPVAPVLRGRALLGRGRLARAASELERAKELSRRVGADGTLRLASLLHAQSLVLLGRTASPVRGLEGDPEHLALAHELAGVKQWRRRHPGPAADELARAVESWRSLGSTCWLGRALALHASMARAAGDEAAAAGSMEEARGVLRLIRTPASERRALLEPVDVTARRER